MKKVSCVSRAGWPSGKFSAVKLCQSSSMSGPSATVKPISPNTAAISSNTCMTGCSAPALGRGPAAGTGPPSRSPAALPARRLPALPCGRARRHRRGSSAHSASGRSPCALPGSSCRESSSGRRPCPSCPSSATRTSSSVARSPAASIAARASFSIVLISDTGVASLCCSSGLFRRFGPACKRP